MQPQSTLCLVTDKSSSHNLFFSGDFTRVSHKLEYYEAGRIIGKTSICFLLFSFETPFDFFVSVKHRQPHQIRGFGMGGSNKSQQTAGLKRNYLKSEDVHVFSCPYSKQWQRFWEGH